MAKLPVIFYVQRAVSEIINLVSGSRRFGGELPPPPLLKRFMITNPCNFHDHKHPNFCLIKPSE